jgi:hypothetical protein
VRRAPKVAPPQPPGVTCCAASSNTSDTVAQVGQNPPKFQFTTLTQSATSGDRILTFEYSLNGLGVSQQMNVTARQFAFVKNNNPSNTCTLGHGTVRSYVYSVFTHPDGTAIVPTDRLSNTAVDESFNVTPARAKFGNALINTNAEFVDFVASCSSKPLTCSQTLIQTLSVAGYPVRTNKLVFSPTGVAYTPQGPTQWMPEEYSGTPAGESVFHLTSPLIGPFEVETFTFRKRTFIFCARPQTPLP